MRRPALSDMALWVGGLLWLAWAPAQAARQPPMDLDELIDRSGVIVEARISRVDPFAGDGIPATHVRYAIERHLVEGVVDGIDGFTLPEGVEADGSTYSGFAGTPEFAPGEVYLLFLRHAPWRISPITHWRDGLLRRVEVAGRTVYVDGGGACVVGLDGALRFGPRVVDPPPSPARGARWSAHPPTPSAVGACLSASEVRLRLRIRLRQLDWRPRPVPTTPVHAVPVFETAAVPR